jgi:hypothetical protein
MNCTQINAQLDAEVVRLDERRASKYSFTLFRDIELEPRKVWLVSDFLGVANFRVGSVHQGQRSHFSLAIWPLTLHQSEPGLVAGSSMAAFCMWQSSDRHS